MHSMGKPEKVETVCTNFNYCPFCRMGNSTCELIRQIARIQKHCLRIVLDDYDSDYDDVLLRKSRKATMEIK